MSRANVLYLTHRVPYPPDKGDRIRNYHLLRHLARRANVHLACLADEPVPPESLAALAPLCARLAIVPIGRASRWLRALGALARGGSASVGAFSSPGLRAVLRDWARSTTFQFTLSSASSLTPYQRLPELRHVPAVVDLVDVDSQKWLDYAAAGSGPRSWLYRLEGRRLREHEYALPTWARAVTLVSEPEADIYRRFCRPGRICAVANGVDLDYFQPVPQQAEPACVFVGALDYRPNIDAACWFSAHVWPEVLRRQPEARLWLVGRSPVAVVRRLGQLPGVEVVGAVPDVRPYLARAAVAVVPLRIARGIQNKVLEALAMAKATVASPQALAALRAEDGVHLLAAQEHEEWVDAVVGLLRDADWRQRLGAAGRRYVEVHHCWKRCLTPFDMLLGQGARARKTDIALPAFTGTCRW
jgi:sugar transferase (PEP-CTERM/EpsH1 system associated)